MKLKFKLAPRFHYTYRFLDVFLSLRHSAAREREFLEQVNAERLYFLNSARAGLSLLMKSIAKGRVLRIGIQPYNCDTAFQAIAKAGCIPVFIDMNPDLTLSSRDLKAKLPNIDILILTHTFGIPADINEIRTIMKGRIIIEDCAHAFLSTSGNKLCGTFGDASVFSMSYGKFPSIGHGGFVIVNNPEIREDFGNLYDSLPEPGFLAAVKEAFQNLVYSLASKPWLYGLITYPVFKRLDVKYDFVQKRVFKEAKGFRVNEHVFFNNLKRYARINAERIRKSVYLLSLIKPSLSSLNPGNNFYLIPLLPGNRDELCATLFRLGYEGGKHFSRSIEVALKYGYIMGTCPVSEAIAREILVMPTVRYLSESDMKRIAAVINQEKNA
jgi:perosamine synthetase